MPALSPLNSADLGVTRVCVLLTKNEGDLVPAPSVLMRTHRVESHSEALGWQDTLELETVDTGSLWL